MGGFFDGLRHVMLPALLLVLGLPMAQVGAESRYNDWELWTSRRQRGAAGQTGGRGTVPD